MPPTTESRSRPRAVALGGTIALLAVASVAGCGGKSAARAPRVPVTIAAAVERAMPFELISTGTVEPLRTASVGSQVGGTVRRVGFREGEEVSEGQVLFELDPRPFRATLERERASLARDRAQAETARLDALRAHALLEQDLLSPAEWEQKHAASEALDATVRADSAAVVDR